MIRALILCTALSGLAVSAAQAAANMEPAFGNTIVTTYPDGRTGHLWLKADGTYQFEGRRKTPSSGRWTVKGERVCLKQSKPSSFPFSYCTPVQAGGIGTTWPGKAPTGEKIQLKLVEGIVK